MAEQKKTKGAPGSASRGSQKNHQADPARQRNPEKKMLRVLKSSGLEMAQAYAKHFHLESELEKPYFVEAVARYNQKKEDRRISLLEHQKEKLDYRQEMDERLYILTLGGE